MASDVGAAEDDIKRRLKFEAKGNPVAARDAYADVTVRIDRIGERLGTHRANHRLDLDLLIFLGQAQLENRNGAPSEVIDAVEQADLPVRQIEATVIRLNTAFDKIHHGRAINERIVQTADVGRFMLSRSNDFRDAMGEALECRVADATYETASMDAERLLAVDPTFLIESRLSLLEVLGFLCTAYVAMHRPALGRHRPYWHGQKTQSERPFHHLRRPGALDPSEIPEGRTAFWREYRRRLTAALVGQSVYWQLDNDIAKCIDRTLRRVMATHDINAMKSFVSTLEKLAACSDQEGGRGT